MNLQNIERLRRHCGWSAALSPRGASDGISPGQAESRLREPVRGHRRSRAYRSISAYIEEAEISRIVSHCDQMAESLLAEEPALVPDGDLAPEEGGGETHLGGGVGRATSGRCLSFREGRLTLGENPGRIYRGDVDSPLVLLPSPEGVRKTRWMAMEAYLLLYYNRDSPAAWLAKHPQCPHIRNPFYRQNRKPPNIPARPERPVLWMPEIGSRTMPIHPIYECLFLPS